MAAPRLPRDQRILHLREWKHDVREYVALRASHRCQTCFQFLGMTGDVDHKIPRRELAETGGDPWAVQNLQYLCGSCHSRKTNAERWGRYARRDPNAIRRSKVPGRARFLAAAGIPANRHATN